MLVEERHQFRYRAGTNLGVGVEEMHIVRRLLEGDLQAQVVAGAKPAVDRRHDEAREPGKALPDAALQLHLITGGIFDHQHREPQLGMLLLLLLQRRQRAQSQGRGPIVDDDDGDSLHGGGKCKKPARAQGGAGGEVVNRRMTRHEQSSLAG